MKKMLLFSVVFIVFSSCIRSEISKATFSSFPRVLDINSIVLDSSENSLLPKYIDQIEDKIILLDQDDDLVKIFGVNDDDYLGGAGLFGKGPGEMVTPWNVTKLNKTDFWVYDASLAKLTKFNLDSIISDSTYNPGVQINLSSDLRSCYYPVWLSDSLLVSPIMSEKNRFAFITSKGELKELGGKFPPNKPANVSNEMHSQAYQSTLCTSNDKSKFALATRYADQIEIYESDGRHVTTIQGPERFKPEYSNSTAFDNNVLVFSPKCRFGYIFVVGTNDYIYALYSGMSRIKNPGLANFGKEIHVFNWDGKPVTKLNLDRYILSFSVDESNDNIYAIQHDPIPAIVKFRLESSRM